MKNKSQYKDRLDWKKSSIKDYKSAYTQGYLDTICEHFGWEKCSDYDRTSYWTIERCIEEALKYESKSGWQKVSSTSYQKARKNGWLDECTTHMIEIKKPPGYWDIKENVLSEALKYNTRSAWHETNGSSYQHSRKNGWYEECIKHMKNKTKSNGHWNIKENVLVEARKYKTPSEWSSKNGGSYGAARKHGWHDECTAHMERVHVCYGHWDIKENCVEDALKYETRSFWHKNSPTAYWKSKIYGWFEECVTHMKKGKPIYLTRERCIEEALKYESKGGWREGNGGSYQKARKNGWFEECVKHMK